MKRSHEESFEVVDTTKKAKTFDRLGLIKDVHNAFGGFANDEILSAGSDGSILVFRLLSPPVYITLKNIDRLMEISDIDFEIGLGIPRGENDVRSPKYINVNVKSVDETFFSIGEIPHVDQDTKHLPEKMHKIASWIKTVRPSNLTFTKSEDWLIVKPVPPTTQFRITRSFISDILDIRKNKWYDDIRIVTEKGVLVMKFKCL